MGGHRRRYPFTCRHASQPRRRHRSACWWSRAGTNTPPPSTRSLKERTTCTGTTPSRTMRPSRMTSARITTSWCSTIFRQEISDAEKTNLRDFVEAGKGIVVLHHAIADYQDWEWWYKEVVGGKYLLKPEGSMPGIDVPARSRVLRSARHEPPHHRPYRNHAPVGRNLQGHVDLTGRESAAPVRCSHQ